MNASYVPSALERDAWDAVAVLTEFDGRTVTRGRMTPEQSHECIRRWLAEGAIERVRPAEGGKNRYRVVAGFERPPRPNGRTPEENMWTAMRGLKIFTATDISAHATTAKVTVTKAKARDYIRFLLAAGYLRCHRKATQTIEARYFLVRMTGVRAPLIRRVQVVEDQNTGAVFHMGGRS